MNRIVLCCLVLGLPAIGFSQGFLDQFPFRKQTEYFDFRYQRNSPQIPEVARFADAFIKLVNRDFFKADFDYPLRVLVLEDRARFKEFLVRELHVNDPPDFGIYFPNYKLFATYEGSGLGTFTHEILHPLVERNLRDRPLWAREGIPTFFEKFYGYWKDKELVAYWGFQNPWRIQQIGTDLTRLNLEKIISDPEPNSPYGVLGRNESSWRMVSMFLWEQDRFKRFLTLIAAHDKGGFPSYFEAAMGIPIKEILPLWQRYLNEVATRRTKILLLPGSRIFETESAFKEFATNNAISIEPPPAGAGKAKPN